MKRSRAWWLYNAVFWPVFLLLLYGGMALAARVWPTRESRESAWLMWSLYGLTLSGAWAAQLIARGACRAAGMSHSGRLIRVLQQAVGKEAPMPDPPAIRYSAYSPRQKRALLWLGLPLIVAMFAAGAVGGWREADWMLFVMGCVGTPFWIWMGTVGWRERGHGDLEVSWRGLRDVWKGRDVPWASVEGGRVIEDRDVGDDVRSEHLRLEDARGRCVWAADIKNLPPDVRADLFAWLRARANLCEPAADA